MKRILLIAFHFPPHVGSSGQQRTLSLVRHFAASKNFEPIVLSANANAYERTSDDQLKDIPSGVRVYRPWAFDSSRHLSVRGRYFQATALPDRWATWPLAAVPFGLWLIRRHKIDAIWSTYPITTAHRIGEALARRSGLPWICDFRDPMVEFDEETETWFPLDESVREARLEIERSCVQRADALVYCTDSARDICLERHTSANTNRFSVVQNGFEERVFSSAEEEMATEEVARRPGVTLLHSGVLYPGDDRDPTPFFRAMSQLCADGCIDGTPIRVMLRATGFDQTYAPLIDELNLGSVIELLPHIEYRSAIKEMLSVDGLLLFQGRTSNPAIPAKLYEYFRAKKPILGLVHPEGETSRLLSSVNIGHRVKMDDVDQIKVAVSNFIASIKAGNTPTLDGPQLNSFSRAENAQQYEEIVNAVLDGRTTSS